MPILILNSSLLKSKSDTLLLSLACFSNFNNLFSGSPSLRYTSPFLSKETTSCSDLSDFITYLFSNHCKALVTSTSFNLVCFKISFKVIPCFNRGNTCLSNGWSDFIISLDIVFKI